MGKRAGVIHTCLLGAVGLLAGVAPPMPGTDAVCACQVKYENPTGEVLDTVNDVLDDWRERKERREGLEDSATVTAGRSPVVTRVEEATHGH